MQLGFNVSVTERIGSVTDRLNFLMSS